MAWLWRPKNLAIKLAKGDWIFSLDADERIDTKLASEIKNAIKNSLYSVYEVPRKSLFISKFMNFSGWTPDFTKRLFKKGTGKFQERLVHEHFETHFRVGRLKTSLIHYSYRDVETVLKKLIHIHLMVQSTIRGKKNTGLFIMQFSMGSGPFLKLIF